MALHPKRRPIQAERLESAGIDVRKEPCLQQSEHTGLQRGTFTLFKRKGARRVRRLLRRWRPREITEQELEELPGKIRQEHEEAGIPTYRLVQGPIPEETRQRLEEFIEKELKGSGGFHKILVTDGLRGAMLSTDGPPRWLPPITQNVRFVQIKSGPPAEGKAARAVPITEDFQLQRVEIPLHALNEEPEIDLVAQMRDGLHQQICERGEQLTREAFRLPPEQADRFVRTMMDPSMVLPKFSGFTLMTEDCKVVGCTWPGRHAHPLDEHGNPDPKRIISEG